MSSYGYDLMANQIPLVLGILLFWLLIKFNPSLRRFVVQHNNNPTHRPDSSEPLQERDQIRDRLYDQLLTKGIMLRKESRTKISSAALHHTGLLDPHAARNLLNLQKTPAKITLLAVSDTTAMRSLLTEKSRSCGLLLAHFLDATLDFMVVE